MRWEGREVKSDELGRVKPRTRRDADARHLFLQVCTTLAQALEARQSPCAWVVMGMGA